MFPLCDQKSDVQYIFSCNNNNINNKCLRVILLLLLYIFLYVKQAMRNKKNYTVKGTCVLGCWHLPSGTDGTAWGPLSRRLSARVCYITVSFISPSNWLDPPHWLSAGNNLSRRTWIPPLHSFWQVSQCEKHESYITDISASELLICLLST